MCGGYRARVVDALGSVSATQRRDFLELKSTASALVAVEFWNKEMLSAGSCTIRSLRVTSCGSDYETGAVPVVNN